MSQELMIIFIKIISNLGLNNNVSVFVRFCDRTIVDIETWSDHLRFILIIFIFIRLQLIENSFSLIIFTNFLAVRNPLSSNDFIVILIIHGIKPISGLDSIVFVVEKNNFHSDNIYLESTFFNIIIKSLEIIYAKCIHVMRPRNLVFNYLAVNLIGTHLSPLEILTKFSFVVHLFLFIELVQRAAPC